MQFLKRIIESIRRYAFMPSQFIRSKATETAEAECHALEHLFTVLTTGTLIGMPALPLPVTFQLLPLMEDDLINLLNNLDTTGQPLSYLFSVLNVN